MSQPGSSQPDPWGRPPDPASLPPVVWETPQPPYVWPFGQGPDYAQVALPAGWGPPSYLAPIPRRRGPLTYLVAALTVLTVLAFASLVALSVFGSDGLTYRNDDYSAPPPDPDPPALPQPRNGQDAQVKARQSALYAQQMPSPIRCRATRLGSSPTSEELKTHADQLTGCLMRAWEDPVRNAGFELYRPSVTVFTGQVDSPCGELGDENAFYCSTDQQIYLGTRLVDRFDDPLAVDMVIAHEFGHLVQGRTAILPSTRAVQQTESGSRRLELNRRLELQADCFAGLWTHAVSRSMGWGDSDHEVFLAAANGAGDRPDRNGDHGKSTSRERWLGAGINTTRIARCNTFLAEPALVE